MIATGSEVSGKSQACESPAALPVRGLCERLEPVSRTFGFDRGTPIDRYYIHAFLERHATDIRGCVLEVGDASYTRRFGGQRVTRSDVLSVQPDPRATIVGCLESGRNIPRGAFDCIILTQVLPMVFDVAAVLRHCRCALRAGGVLLATAPGISQISRYDMERWGDYWRFTTASLRRLLSEVFPAEPFEIGSFGNVRAASALLYGLAAEELNPPELDTRDDDYPVTLSIRAVCGADAEVGAFYEPT